MKQSFHSASLFLLLLLLISSSIVLSSRLLATQQGEISVLDMEGSDSTFTELMGIVENCRSEDEECLKRRMMMEAHLDYIYTQNHKH